MRTPPARTLLAALLLAAAFASGCETATTGANTIADDTGVGRVSVSIGINDPYQGDVAVEEWVERFEREGREVYDQRKQIVAALGLQRGMDVADVGAGTGVFVPLFARAVDPGTVMPVDLVPNFIEHIRKQAKEQGLTNVVPVLGTERSVQLPPDSVDLVFACDTYHHFEQPGPVLASIRRALRKDGQLVVIDFRRIPGVSTDWVLGHVRAGEDVVAAEIEAAGFVRMEAPDLLKDNYMLRFRKDG